ncbi:MAG: hypothetical protein M9894_15665 [Planctomycetes bacterium]|nr:hypothetical protein [Planctomycetota bacterium]
MRRVAALALLVFFLAAPARADVVTGFDPALDGPRFPNTGDYASVGNCWGMALLAIDNYLRRRAGEAPSAGAVIAFPEEGHLPDQAAASAVNARATEDDLARVWAGRRPADDPAPILAALERIGRTGVPEVLAFWTPGGGHTVVVYGQRDGALLTYDPNFPGEAIAWPFDPARGLGRHPREARDPAMYADVEAVRAIPFHEHGAVAALPEVRAACDAAAPVCMDRFAPVEVAVRPGPGGLVEVTGRVGRGREVDDHGAPTSPPAYVWLAVDGQPVTSVNLDAQGRFRARLPRGTLAPGGHVRVVALSDDGRLAGFADAHRPAATTREPARGVGLARTLAEATTRAP